MMKETIIKYYAVLEDVTAGETPKYKITKSVGNYEPMEDLRGRDNNISFYLISSKDSGSNDNAPAMKLQGKNSINFTGLKEYYVNGKMSGYAYGYPLDKKTYSKANKPNPFFQFKEDCFLFVMHSEKGNGKPSKIEMVVIEDGKPLAPSYLKQMMIGGFSDELEQLRSKAE